MLIWLSILTEVLCGCAYIHEVGQPLHRKFRGGGAVGCASALRQIPKLHKRHAAVAHQAAQASGLVKGDSEKDTSELNVAGTTRAPTLPPRTERSDLALGLARNKL